MAEANATPTPTRGPEHERLEVFLGRWTAEGRLPGASGTPMVVTEDFEWLPGRFFLLQREEMQFGNQGFKTTKVLGYDATKGAYVVHHFDSLGYHRTYSATERDGVWSFSGEHERATFTVAPDGQSFTASWQQRATGGAEWSPLCEFRATKVR